MLRRSRRHRRRWRAVEWARQTACQRPEVERPRPRAACLRLRHVASRPSQAGQRGSRADELLTQPPEPSPPRVWIIASNEQTRGALMLHARANVAVLYLCTCDA